MSVPSTPQQYDVYDIAHLAGGLPRLADTAVVALLQTGRIRAAEDGGLTVVSPGRRHPVEAAVLDAIGPRYRRSVGTVCWKIADDERVTAVADRLRQDGLLRTPSAWWAPRRPVHRTAAGRQLLSRLRSAPPEDAVAAGTRAMEVALQGVARMVDQDLYRRVFAPPPSRRPRGRVPYIEADARTQLYAYGAGAWGGEVGGWGGCGGFDGGFGGGDGGCGGGDGGGGGC